MNSKPIAVDVVSDVVCPWCFLGSKRLERAIAVLPQAKVEVRWRPFQLDPTLPKAGLDREAYMLGKFGSKERIDAAHARLEDMGREEGIDFRFDAMRVAPNTLDAHRVIRWAAPEGAGIQSAVVRALFSLYFERGVDIGDRQVLIDAARSAGMDAAKVETLLATTADEDGVRQEIEMAAQLGIRGVPCFIVAGKYAVMDAQPVEVLLDALQKAAVETEGM